MFIFWFYRQKQKSLKKYTELWDGIKNKIKTINWPLNKLLKLHMLTIIVRSAYEESGKFYPQL